MGVRRPRAMQDGQLGGIPPVGLDPVAGAAGDESGGNDLTRDPARGEIPIELEATRASLVAAADGPLPPDLVDEAADVG